VNISYRHVECCLCFSSPPVLQPWLEGKMVPTFMHLYIHNIRPVHSFTQFVPRQGAMVNCYCVPTLVWTETTEDSCHSAVCAAGNRSRKHYENFNKELNLL
jgi:hypothetical protein